MAERYLKSDPYPWPYNGDLRPENTALVIIDMQTDFCGKGGYVDLMGYDISNSRACIEPINAVLRAIGFAVEPAVPEPSADADLRLVWIDSDRLHCGGRASLLPN